MTYPNLIFDLYGTLVDIHTDENDTVWEKTALFFGYYGAHYTGDGLRSDFRAAMAAREARAGQSYECFPDIPFEEVMAELFRAKGVATLYMHTNLTPPDQTAADPGLHPCSAPEGCRHYEYKGWDWMELAQLIAGL